jgi:O-methyltransferase
MSCKTTVLLATRNRPQELQRLFVLWKETGFARSVVVLDSSSPKRKAINREICSRFSFAGPVLHREYAESIYPFEKWQHLMAEVATPYVIFAAEDDFLFSSALIRCEEFLDNNEAYGSCQGFHLSFQRYGNKIGLAEDSFTTSNDAETPEERIWKQFNHYGHFTYGLRRTSIWNNWPDPIKKASQAIYPEAGGAQEMLDAMLCLVAGKVKRLPIVQGIRNGRPTTEDGWKRSFLFGPHFSEVIVSFKRILTELLSSRGKIAGLDYDLLLNECWSLYFGKTLNGFKNVELHDKFSALDQARNAREKLATMVEGMNLETSELKIIFDFILKHPLEIDYAKTDDLPRFSSTYQVMQRLNATLNPPAPTPGVPEALLAIFRPQGQFWKRMLRQPKKTVGTGLMRLGEKMGGGANKRIFAEAPPVAVAKQAAPPGYLYDEDNIRTPRNHDFIHDPRFVHAVNVSHSTPFGSRGNYHGRWNLHVVLWAATRAIALKSDIVQLGVFEGSEAMGIADYTDFANTQSRMFLMDTFTGVPEAKWTAAEIAAGADSAQWAYKEAGDTYADVCRRFARFPNVEVIQGIVPDALPQIKSHRIGLLLLDLNCAAPERAAADFLWDRVVEGGMVLSDDYGHSREGAGYYAQKIAFDEFAKSKSLEVLTLPTGHGIIMK